MKHFFTLLAVVLITATTYAQIGINNETPDASAALDVTSTTAGLLMPRMTNAQRQAISNPAAGLQVFVTDFDGGRFMFYDGTEWGTLTFTKKRPDAPTIGTATLDNTQATVSFTAPSSDGGSAITSYTATSSPGDFTGTISQSGSGSIIVSGLTSGTAYTFTVTATNAIGTSLASAASNSVIPAQFLPAGFETVAYEGFDYTNGQDLINVGGGTGWTSNWQQFYLNSYISARSTSYSYTGLSTTGGKATFDNNCYGSCNTISSSGRKLTATTEGVLYLQFLADLGSQAGGGTPHVRLDFNGSTTVVLGKEGDGHNWVLYDSNTGTSASTNISGYSTVRLVIVRFDYTNNTMRMYIDPNLSTFDYSSPSGHNAEISGISIPYFDEIGPMFRKDGTPGIDEIHVFKESS